MFLSSRPQNPAISEAATFGKSNFSWVTCHSTFGFWATSSKNTFIGNKAGAFMSICRLSCAPTQLFPRVNSGKPKCWIQVQAHRTLAPDALSGGLDPWDPKRLLPRLCQHRHFPLTLFQLSEVKRMSDFTRSLVFSEDASFFIGLPCCSVRGLLNIIIAN